MICHSYVQTCCTICWVWAFQIEDVTFIDVSMSSMNEASMEVILVSLVSLVSLVIGAREGRVQLVRERGVCNWCERETCAIAGERSVCN